MSQAAVHSENSKCPVSKNYGLPPQHRCHDASGDAHGESRARAGDVFPRRWGACPAKLHPDCDPDRGARAVGEPQHLGTEHRFNGEFLYLTSS